MVRLKGKISKFGFQILSVLHKSIKSWPTIRKFSVVLLESVQKDHVIVEMKLLLHLILVVALVSIIQARPSPADDGEENSDTDSNTNAAESAIKKGKDIGKKGKEKSQDNFKNTGSKPPKSKKDENLPEDGEGNAGSDSDSTITESTKDKDTSGDDDGDKDSDSTASEHNKHKKAKKLMSGDDEDKKSKKAKKGKKKNKEDNESSGDGKHKNKSNKKDKKSKKSSPLPVDTPDLPIGNDLKNVALDKVSGASSNPTGVATDAAGGKLPTVPSVGKLPGIPAVGKLPAIPAVGKLPIAGETASTEAPAEEDPVE